MYAVLRTHRTRHDRAWLPPSIRRKAWAAMTPVWLGAGALGIGVVAAFPASLIAIKALAAGGLATGVTGRQAWHHVFRRELERMTRGEVPLAEMAARGEGELVRVRGTIACEEPIRGILVDAPCVYRRLRVDEHGSWIHEAAVDFELIGDDGKRIGVQAGGARWMTEDRESYECVRERILAADIGTALRELLERARGYAPKVQASERVLPVGARVELVGYKTVAPHAEGLVLDLREPPMRATLTSGPELPVVINLVDELPR